MRANRFEIYKKKGRWYWALHKGTDTRPGPIARSGRSYVSAQAARASIESAKDAMNGIVVTMSDVPKASQRRSSHKMT